MDGDLVRTGVQHGAVQTPPSQEWKSGRDRVRPAPINPAYLRFSLLILDFCAVCISGVVTFLTAAGSVGAAWASTAGLAFVLVIVASPALAGPFGTYRDLRWRRNRVEPFRFLAPVGGAFALVCATMTVSSSLAGTSDRPVISWLLTWAVVSLTLLTLVRLVFYWRIDRWRRAGRLQQRVAIVGVTEAGRRFIKFVETAASDFVDVVGVFDDRWKRRGYGELAEYPVAGSVADLVHYARIHHVDRVILALPLSAGPRILEVMKLLRTLTSHVSLMPEELDVGLLQRRTQRSGDAILPLIHVYEPPLQEFQRLLKRLTDMVVSSCLILLCSPAMLLTALAVRLDSPGDVLFAQTRTGLNHRDITIWKFRTLYQDRLDWQGSRQVSIKDDRVTRIGEFLRRTSLDELPQLFSVLRGDMSFVGPRPFPKDTRIDGLTPHEIVAQFAERYRVKPGLTGWAQVNGSRGPLTSAQMLEDRILLDLYYIDNWSLWLDIVIISRTILVVLGERSAR